MRASALVFGASLMAAVSHAAAEVTTAEISKYDDKCYHCINEGNLFCSLDGDKGKCLAASCVGGNEDETFKCVLAEHDCKDPA